MLSIPFSSIVEGRRARAGKNYGDLTGLQNSLRSIGSIHPIVLSREGEVYTLIAGGRRYAAMKGMGVTELHEGSILNPSKLGFTFKESVPDHELREAELDENLYRLEMEWIDKALAVADIHELKKARNLKWGVEQTAELLGMAGGFSILYPLKVAKLLRANDKEVLACRDMKDAISVMVKRQEDAALAELSRRNAAKTKAKPIVTVDLGGTSSFLDTIQTSLGPKIQFENKGGDSNATANRQVIDLSATTVQPSVAEETSIPLSSMFTLGDSLRDVMPSYPDASFDHIVTDIPYGIDMDNLTTKGKADIEDQHEVEANIDQMPAFLEQSFRLVKPRGFCVFFMDLDHWNMLQSTAKAIGWKVQDWPLLWIKTHPCQNQGAAYNYTKTYEAAMVLRKDSETVLRKQRPNAHWIGDGSAERKLYNNKFAKPFLLWKELIYDNIAFPGQTIYDPFCGEASSSRAAANCGLIPYGSEISSVHFNRGVEHMKAVYALIHNSNVKFT